MSNVPNRSLVGKRTFCHGILGIVVLLVVLGGAVPAPGVIIFDGNQLPSAQGWTTVTNIVPPLPESTDGVSTFTLNTLAGTTTDTFGRRLLYSFNPGVSLANGFTLEADLEVVNADPHNPFDAGIVLMGSYTVPPFGGVADRSEMIWFENAAIGWGDDAQSAAVNTTIGFKTYKLDVDAAGNATVFVNGTPVLSRTGFVTNGIIAFGDQTNDGGSVTSSADTDGHFNLRQIRLTPVPEPATMVLLALGVIPTLLRKRRKK